MRQNHDVCIQYSVNQKVKGKSKFLLRVGVLNHYDIIIIIGTLLFMNKHAVTAVETVQVLIMKRNMHLSKCIRISQTCNSSNFKYYYEKSLCSVTNWDENTEVLSSGLEQVFIVITTYPDNACNNFNFFIVLMNIEDCQMKLQFCVT